MAFRHLFFNGSIQLISSKKLLCIYQNPIHIRNVSFKYLMCFSTLIVKLVFWVGYNQKFNFKKVFDLNQILTLIGVTFRYFSVKKRSLKFWAYIGFLGHFLTKTFWGKKTQIFLQLPMAQCVIIHNGSRIKKHYWYDQSL